MRPEQAIKAPYAQIHMPTVDRRRHLLSIQDLDETSVQSLLDRARFYFDGGRNRKKFDLLKGKTVINAFFENSTRTRSSFEIAGKRLGADVINLSADSSSTKKGETLLDTARTLDAMQADALVIRHSESGAPAFVARNIGASVINAGDGCHEHPTQALLDLATIREAKGRVEGLTVAICGDVLHSRVARSNVLLLHMMGAKVRLVGPGSLIPAALESLGVPVFHDLEQGLKGADVVMMLRLQLERMGSGFVPSVREYFYRFGLSRAKLAYATGDAIVLHPGPMNRGVEIESRLADDLERSYILNQVETGVAMRQAILELLLA